MTTRSEALLSEAARWLPASGGAVVCAVSGGLDSMCLLHLLLRWSERSGGEVTAAHFNHGLRGEAADRDETFVRDWCARRGIPLVCGRGDTRALAAREGRSSEEAARTLRYAFLRRAAAQCGADWICTAHHADDNAETILLNLIRGTGLKGLCGMQHLQNGICRPLLDVPRGELEAYAAENGLPHVEDETNADADAAARNLLRLRVMPLLKEQNPRAVEHINAAGRQLRCADQDLDAAARRYLDGAGHGPEGITLPRASLLSLPPSVRFRVFLECFDLLGVGRRDVASDHLEALDALAQNSHTGAQLSLPRGVVARGTRDALLMTCPAPLPARRELRPGEMLRWGEYRITLLERPEGEGFSLRASPEEIVSVAPCPAGERLCLPGTAGRRTVKRLCLDRGIDFARRDRLPAFYLSERLAAVWPLGVDTAFLPEHTERRFIQIIREAEERQI